jgi:hypothetical protein
MERRRELLVGLVIVVLIAAGLALDAGADAVDPPTETAATTGLIHQRALFCPPTPQDTEGSTTLTTWATSDDPVAISVSDEDATELESGRVHSDKLSGSEAVNVVGSGAPLLADASMTFTEPFEAAGAAPCSHEASPEWYFPEGSTDIGYNQRLLIYNPFPDEAVVRITFVTKKGIEAKAGLAKVAVPSGESIEVAVREKILPHPALATVISAVRGRVVAWKVLFSKAEGRQRGVEFSLGAIRGSTHLFFPLGKVDEGSDERITILNPEDKSAKVTVTLLTKDGVLPAPQFVEEIIRAGDTKILELSTLGGKDGPPVGPLSARIESVNGVGIIAEQTLEFGSAGFEGVASEFGMDEAAKSWWVGPPAAGATTQDALVVLNVGAKVAHVDVTLESASGEPLHPRTLQGIEIPAGRRGTILLPDTDGGPFVAFVETDQDVVIARIAQVGSDVAVIAGVPAE